MNAERFHSDIFSFRIAKSWLVLFAFCMLVAVPGWAAEDDDAPDAGGPVANALAARLSSVEGQVRVVQGTTVIADPAYANLSLFEGSQVITGEEGRGEIEFQDGSIARLSPNTTLTLTKLQREGTGSNTSVTVVGGLAYFELQPSNGEHKMRVHYGAASFTASSFTVVRITQDSPPGELAVFSGNVHLEQGSELNLDLHGGESVQLAANGGDKYTLNETIEPDSWDTWNADRDQALNAESASQTAASNGVNNSGGMGMNDLDANGNWYNVPGQGYVWSPYDAEAEGASWDPYGYGNWTYYPAYGYTFTSGYGWGYAPYQCGLWNFYDDFGWGWAPGRSCNPWWGTGGGWGWNYGNLPRGYKPPRRPGRPFHPRPVGGRNEPVHVASIPIDRRRDGGRYQEGGPKNLPGGRVSQSATIAGHAVMPLPPLQARSTYERENGYVGGGSGASGGSVVTGRTGGQTGYYPRPSSGAVVGGGTVSRPAPGGGASRPYSPPPAPRSYTPPPAPRSYSPPPAPRSYSPPPAPSAPRGGGSPHR
jgi:hypothetical protein